MDYKDKMITLTDGYQYVILEDTQYNGSTYVLANEVIDGDLGPTIVLFKVEGEEANPKFREERDLSVAEMVLAKMAH